MPLFQISKGKLGTVSQGSFKAEKQLQALVERNLNEVFNCRFVASEFSTGPQHAGRIDTLALSEDNNPVIIEYKKVESSDLINQSLFYLSWLSDHRGDFEVAAMRALGKVDIDWTAVRVICIAPNYKRYDLHAVQMMGANIELWTFRLFENDTLYLEEVFQRSVTTAADDSGRPLVAGADLTPGKKAAITRATGSYTVDEHLDGKPASIRELGLATIDFVTGLDPSIQVAPKKYYIAFKLAQNLACIELQKNRLIMYLKLDPKRDKGPPGISRDVSSIGHFGTGDLEISLSNQKDLDAAKPWIERAYRQLGA